MVSMSIVIAAKLWSASPSVSRRCTCRRVGNTNPSNLSGQFSRPPCASSTWARGSSVSSSLLGVDVLKAHLAAGDQLVVLGPADLDLPQLLCAALVDRGREHAQAAVSMVADEVGDVRGW
jgi:hypothetical protein